jgi:hypothetical protein
MWGDWWCALASGMETYGPPVGGVGRPAPNNPPVGGVGRPAPNNPRSLLGAGLRPRRPRRPKVSIQNRQFRNMSQQVSSWTTKYRRPPDRSPGSADQLIELRAPRGARRPQPPDAAVDREFRNGPSNMFFSMDEQACWGRARGAVPSGRTGFNRGVRNEPAPIRGDRGRPDGPVRLWAAIKRTVS